MKIFLLGLAAALACAAAPGVDPTALGVDPTEGAAAGAAAEDGDATAVAPEQAPEAAPAAPLRSMLVRPVHASEEIPESRAVRQILIVHKDVPGVSRSVRRTVEEARSLIETLHEQLASGADFAGLARSHSNSPVARSGGVLGTFARGVLGGPLDEFLFAAEVGDISDVIELPSGLHVLQRIERDAACLQILVAKSREDARAKCQALLERALAGEDFGVLAREHSDDEASAARGGQLAIFERGPADVLLKKAAFETALGEISGPLETPQGWHLVKRVPIAALDPELREQDWIRVRAIFLSFGGAPDYPYWIDRTQYESGVLAQELYERISAGEDMAALAAEYDDDLDGRQRRGNLGWVHRRTPGMSPVLRQMFLRPAPTLQEPVQIAQGWVILRREL